MENVCRLCAKEKPLKKLIHNIHDRKLNIEQKLNDCCRWNSLITFEYDELPKKFCKTCFNKLENSWNFAVSVAEAQHQLLKQIDEVKSDLPPFEYVNAVIIKEEPIESTEECAKRGDYQLAELTESIEQNEKIKSVEAAEPIESVIPNDKDDTFEEFNYLLKSNNSNSEADSLKSPLLEDNYDILKSKDNMEAQSNNNEQATEPKPRKKRYDARQIDFDEIRKKRLQKIPGSLSRLCDTCGREFASVNALRRHNLIHLGQAPHECKTCGKRFRTKYNLRVSKGSKTFLRYSYTKQRNH